MLVGGCDQIGDAVVVQVAGRDAAGEVLARVFARPLPCGRGDGPVGFDCAVAVAVDAVVIVFDSLGRDVFVGVVAVASHQGEVARGLTREHGRRLVAVPVAVAVDVPGVEGGGVYVGVVVVGQPVAVLVDVVVVAHLGGARIHGGVAVVTVSAFKHAILGRFAGE